MQLKDNRKMIYDFIEKEIGEIKPNVLGYLSSMIKDYSKLHNEKVVKNNNLLKNKIMEYRDNGIRVTKRIKKPIKATQPKIIKADKPRKDEPYFNNDFIK